MYDQPKMRSHPIKIKYLENKKMERFPSIEKRALAPVRKDKIHVYCKCRMPEGEDSMMAFCPKCCEWYHQKCDQIPASYLQTSIVNISAPNVVSHIINIQFLIVSRVQFICMRNVWPHPLINRYSRSSM